MKKVIVLILIILALPLSAYLIQKFYRDPPFPRVFEMKR